MVGASGAATLVGGGGGDLLVSDNRQANRPSGTPPSAHVLVAGAGAETLHGGGSDVGDVYFGGVGTTLVVAGAGRDTVVTESGAATVFAHGSDIFTGSGQSLIVSGDNSSYIQFGAGPAAVFAGGADVFGFVNGQAGGNVSIMGFSGGDFLFLGGYAGSAAADALATATIAGGATQLHLPDDTRITLFGVTDLTLNQIG
jgi:Ca2+-binding RTX toxin-like protein